LYFSNLRRGSSQALKSNSLLCLTGFFLRPALVVVFLPALALGVAAFLVVVRFLVVAFLPAFALGVTLLRVVLRFFVVVFLVALGFTPVFFLVVLFLLLTVLFAILML
jgi:hypothetical protein